MPFDPAFTINTIYPAAASAYTIMNVPAPPMPDGYTLVGPIIADPKKSAPASATTQPEQHRMADNMLVESNIFGLVCWNATATTALVAFRGTKSIWEWIADVDAAPVPYLPNLDVGLVHMGFQIVYQQIRDSVRQLIAAGCPGVTRILVTGHSLGGSVAVLGGFDIAKNMPFGVIPELYTLAGPRAGAPDFADEFKKLIPVCYRVVNFMDVVPQVPLPPLYEHVGTEVLVKGGFRPLDVTYAHHLTTYLAGLQKLAPIAVPSVAVAAGGPNP